MKSLHRFLATVGVLCGLSALGLATASHRTESRIAEHHAHVRAQAQTQSRPADRPAEALPEPVQRYLRFAFPQGTAPALYVEMSMQGQFRRPGQEGFAPTHAQQTAALHTPAMVFDATTPMAPGVWARAYDAYVNGQMEMKARILSALTVVDEQPTTELNRISLRRWLLESPTFPHALLPGGVVHWEAVGPDSARAVASHQGVTASLLARFAEDGRLLSFESEEDGDLGTPYHGSGEHVARRDYHTVQGVRVPLGFTISRRAQGRTLPFWEGRITTIRFVTDSGATQASAPPA